MSSPNSVATAILANTTTTTTNGRNIDTNYYDAIGGIETPLTGGSLLSVSIGNITDSMASSMISPRTGGRWGNRRDLPHEYSPTSGAGVGPSGGAQPPSWLTSDDDDHNHQYSERSSLHSELDTRPFPSFSRTSLVSGTGSIAPDSSFYSQLGRFQRVRNSVSLAQPWRRRRKDSTTTGSYATTTDSEDNDDASTISGIRHDLRQDRQYEEQRQYGREREREAERECYCEREEEHDDATTPPVDLFSQHQFIMPKPDETTPLIGGAGGDEESLICSPDAENNETSPAALARHRFRLLVLRLMLVALAGMVVVGGVLLVVRFRARPPASGESQRTEK